MKQIPSWIIAVIFLLFAAFFFRFVLSFYNYMACCCIFIAALVVIHHFAAPGLWRAVVALTCLGLMYFCAVEIPIVSNARTDKDCERDYLIVLGAAVHGDSPSLSLQHRLEGAQDYLERYPDSVAILSGGQGKGENLTEAQCMYDWLIAAGISPQRLIMEPKATSTMENLSFSFDIIRELGDEPSGNVAILSSSYHLYRAKCMAQLQGVEAAGVAGNPGYPVYMLNCFIREAFGVTHLWLLGR